MRLLQGLYHLNRVLGYVVVHAVKLRTPEVSMHASILCQNNSVSGLGVRQQHLRVTCLFLPKP